jgi:hypothetical protein
VSDEIKSIQAKDAFVYVDTFRRLKVESAEAIDKEKKKLEERYWNQKTRDVSPRFWAEMRACEHALDWALKHKEPGLVVLGEADEQGNPKESAESRETRIALHKLKEDHAAVARQLQFAHAREQELETEIIRRGQEALRFKHKLEQTQATWAVIATALAVTIIALGGILWSR